MTATERQGIISDVVQSVLQSLRTNSARIVDLTRVTSLPANSYIELSDGKRIKADDLANAIQTRILNEAVYPIISTLTPGEGGEYVFDGVTSGTFNEDNNTIELKNAAGTVISTIDLSSLISEGGQSSVATASIELANKVFVPSGKKILVVGASFAEDANGWDKLVQDITGIEVVNEARGALFIANNVAQRMIDANSSQPHGSLFFNNGRDTFYDYGAIIIFHSHNYDVLLNENDYKARDVQYYKAHPSLVNGSKSNAASYPPAFDYVLKQLKEWSCEYDSTTETISQTYMQKNRTKNTPQILLCSHWHPGRRAFNESSRKLAERFGIAYCALDEHLGFTADDKVHAELQVDGIDPGTTREGDYNRSVLHAQITGLHEGKLFGRTDVIDDIVWGWHPQRLSNSIDYGYGTIVTRNGNTSYIPWVQRAIGVCVARCIATDTESCSGGGGGGGVSDGCFEQGEGEYSVEQMAGVNTPTASGLMSSAFGYKTTASGDYSHAEGSNTVASGKRSHAEGESCVASGVDSHAEGWNSEASAHTSHAEGRICYATAFYSHSGGYATFTYGTCSFAHGSYLKVLNHYEAAFGRSNISMKDTSSQANTTLFSIGCGDKKDIGSKYPEITQEDAEAGYVEEVVGGMRAAILRKNAFDIRQNGDMYFWYNGEYTMLQELIGRLEATIDDLAQAQGVPVHDSSDAYGITDNPGEAWEGEEAPVNYDYYEPVGSFGDPDNEYEPVGTFTTEGFDGEGTDGEGSDGEGSDGEGTDSEGTDGE